MIDFQSKTVPTKNLHGCFVFVGFKTCFFSWLDSESTSTEAQAVLYVRLCEGLLKRSSSLLLLISLRFLLKGVLLFSYDSHCLVELSGTALVLSLTTV